MGQIFFRDEDILVCLERVSEIREIYEMYVLNGKDERKSIDDLLWVCEQYLDKKVVVKHVDLPAEGSSIHAAFWAMSDGSYIIGLLSGMTDEEERFVLCKELFHVIFDEESRRSLALAKHVEEYTSNIAVERGEPNCPAAWETLAEIAATEFLLPYDRRVQMAANVSTIDFAKIATHFRLPRFHVEVAFGKGNLEYIGRHMATIRAKAHPQ